MSRVVLYSKPGCHLCDDARWLLDGWGIAYDVVESDPGYELRVPVIEVDGEVVAEAPIDPRRLERALRKVPRAPSAKHRRRTHPRSRRGL
ncbi:MAG: glutaredoxin family protein [Actinomycetota bacterium]